MSEETTPVGGGAGERVCSECSTTNRLGARFCASCGAGFGVRACVNCRADLPDGARFCDSCGAKVGAPRPSTLRGTGGPAAPPASLLGGRYRLGRLLGEGAAKRVHHGVDEHLGRDVAIAIVKTEELGEEAAARLGREIHALVELAGDPSIVTIFDAVETPGAQYVVTEYLPGGDLQTLLNRKSGPLDLGTVVSVGLDVLRALERAHGAGIVHRDVKPANVWLDAEGRARLGDFGLSFSDHARITKDGEILGTAEYISPEAAMHGRVGPAADLYSFGALLYRMVCGRPPFTSGLPYHVIQQHISSPPVPPSRLSPVPGALEALILALLEKQPGDRPASAIETRRSLEELADSGLSVSSSARGYVGHGFVGRDAELRQVRRLADSASVGAGALLLVEGEAGIGKTRLVQELSAYARARGFQVVWSRGHEGPGVPPYWPWQQVLRECLVESGPALEAALAGVREDLALALPDIEVAPEREASTPEGEVERFRLGEATVAFLRAAGSDRPLLVVLDDLEWADPESLWLLAFVTRELSGACVLVAATCRFDEFGRHEALARALAEVVRVPSTVRLGLSGLPSEAVAMLVEDVSGKVPPIPLLERITERTDGNPQFVQDLVRTLPSDPSVWENPRTDRWSWSLTIPRSVIESVNRRLDHLSLACNEVLAVAAVAGRTFPEDIVGQVAGVSHGRLLDLLEEAQAAGVVTELRDTPGRYQFVQPLVREALYEGVGRAGRIRLHLRLGEALEAKHGGNLDAHLDELAHHFFEAAPGGVSEKALDYSRLAGHKALTGRDGAAAAEHFERALRVCAMTRSDDAARCDVLIDLGEALTISADAESARAAFTDAAELAGVLGLPRRYARAALGYAGILNTDWKVDTDVVLLLERALSGLPEVDDPLRARLTARLAQELRHSDDDRTRLTMAHEAVAMARRGGDRQAIAYTLLSRALTLTSQDLSTVMDTAQECLTLAESVYDRDLVLYALCARFSGLCSLGDLHGAIAEAEQHRLLAEASNTPLHRGLAMVIEASIAAWRGDFDTADTCCATVAEIGDRYGLDVLRNLSLTGSLMIELDRGRLAEQRAELHRLVDAHPGYVPLKLLAAFVDAGAGDAEPARTLLSRLGTDKFVSLPETRGHLLVPSLLADLAVVCGDTGSASALFDVLVPHAGECVLVSPLGPVRGPVTRWLGILAAASGRWEECFTHFAAATAWEAGAEAPAFAATTGWWYGQALKGAGELREGDDRLDVAQRAMDALGITSPPLPPAPGFCR